MKKFKMILLGIASISLFSGCVSNHKESEKNSKSTTISTTQSSSIQQSSSQEKAFTYADINDRKSDSQIFSDFVDQFKKDNAKKADSIMIVLYKPDCEDCKLAEETITDHIQTSKRSAEMIAHVENFKYHVVAVDITKEVPEYIQNIYGIASEDGNYYTPTVVVETLKKASDGNLYWDMFDKKTGTSEEGLINVMDYYIRPDYLDFLNEPANNDSRYLLR
ncbi:hypothetical protein P9705_001273 [Enterococcus faecalis]|nr:hypothetical protein [Enterococcus faecalis]